MELVKHMFRIFFFLIVITFVAFPFILFLMPFRDLPLPTGCFPEKDVYGFPIDVVTIQYTGCLNDKLDAPITTFNQAGLVYDILYFAAVALLVYTLVKKLRSKQHTTELPPAENQAVSEDKKTEIDNSNGQHDSNH